jgi:hypothetical protein
MKYKPGMKNQYMSRWCQVTKSHFLYYAEGVPYASCLGRPLAVIPLDAIQSVKRVFVEVPERNEKLSHLKNFQFEIFLRKGQGEQRFSSRIVMNNSTAGDEKSFISPLMAKKI